MKVLLTGCCGFIGYHTGLELLKQGHEVFGVDDINDYYSKDLKLYRLDKLKDSGLYFRFTDICDKSAMTEAMKEFKPEVIINLAARAGVRYSLVNPYIYAQTNVLGTLNLLEMARQFNVKKFILASTSSLYAGQEMPFSEDLSVNTPISPYAASKKGAEAMCYTYHYLHGIDVTVFRFFTVYGECGRPDMCIFEFIEHIRRNEPIIVYGDGLQSRDFTYVKDIANGVIKGMKLKGFQTINLGGNKPYKLQELIINIELNLSKTAKINYMPEYKTDIRDTWADITKAKELLNWCPQVSLEVGISKTVKWHKTNKRLLNNVKLFD